jgi:predicted homoserine dehydrogenase-like protein
MMILDRALERREQEGRPVRVGLVGAGYMGRAVARQFLTPLTGLRLAAIANHRLEGAQQAFHEAGVVSPEVVKSAAAVEEALALGRPAVTEDPSLLCAARGIDAIIEVTGQVEYGARVVLDAVAGGKHVILMNAELDATLGPILKVRAERAGVVYSDTEGDEPGVALNLYRFVKTIGYRPVMAGNIKGFYDPYRTPETQQGFAERTGQKARMVTSFADGTKLSMETTLVANATGLKVGKRGMLGRRCAHVKEIVNHFTPEQLRQQGLVDFVLGAEPGSGAFVVGYDDDAVKKKYMSYFKMGDGPLYVFYTPFHLPHLEVPITVARAVLFGDAAVAPLGAPVCDVISMAKRDLHAGEALDGIGGFTCYGMIENSEVSLAEKCLPMGVSEGCRLTRDVVRDQAITYADVELPAGRLCDALRAEQNACFARSAKEASIAPGGAMAGGEPSQDRRNR